MKNVYILEDTEYLHKRYTMLLHHMGIGAVCFKEAKEFIKAVQRDKPDLLMLDYFFAFRPYDGVKVAQEIRETRIKTPIIVVSGNLSADIIHRFISLNVKGFLQKPFTNEELLDFITGTFANLDEQLSWAAELDEKPLWEEKEIRTVVFDDSKQICYLYEKTLGREDFRVESVSTFDELRNSVHKKERVRLMIMDYSIPNVDFATALSFVEDHYPNALRILVTGSTEINTIRDNYGSKFIKIFAKPIPSYMGFKELILELVKQHVPK